MVRPKKQPPLPSDAKIDLDPQVRALVQLLNTFQSELAMAGKALLRERGLSERSLFIIALIEMGLNRPSMLIDYFDAKPSTMTFELNKLVEAGLVGRSEFAEDRRSNVLNLTREGRRIFKKMSKMLNAFMQPRIATLEPGELETFLAIGYKIVQTERSAPTGLEHRYGQSEI